MSPHTAIEVLVLGFPVVGVGVALVVALWKVIRRRRSGLSPSEQYERDAAELRTAGYLRRSGYAGGGLWGIGAGGYLGGSGGCGGGGHGGHGGGCGGGHSGCGGGGGGCGGGCGGGGS